MNHGYGFIATDERIKELEKYMWVLSTNTDLNHIEYVSTVEFKKHPFFGTQWHPEKVQFEWQDDSIPHGEVAQFVSKKGVANVCGSSSEESSCLEGRLSADLSLQPSRKTGCAGDNRSKTQKGQEK